MHHTCRFLDHQTATCGRILQGRPKTPITHCYRHHLTVWERKYTDAAKAMGATAAPVESKDLMLRAPEIAENGNVVRIGAQSNIPGTTQIAFVVEKNPSALAANFDIMAGTDANVETNIKMGQSSNVYALAKAGDKYFFAVKEVKVTLGGCGG